MNTFMRVFVVFAVMGACSYCCAADSACASGAMTAQNSF